VFRRRGRASLHHTSTLKGGSSGAGPAEAVARVQNAPPQPLTPKEAAPLRLCIYHAARLGRQWRRVRLRLRTLAEHTEPTEQRPRAAAERARLRSAETPRRRYCVAWTHVGFRVDVRSVLQKQCADGRVAFDSGKVQRRPAVLRAHHAATRPSGDGAAASARCSRAGRKGGSAGAADRSPVARPQRRVRIAPRVRQRNGGRVRTTFL
jgi:hypothetical protein